MKYAVAMGIMGLALAAGPMLYPSVWFLFPWPALSFANVAYGYAHLGPRVFGKRSDGKVRLPLKVLNLPYLVFTWVVWHVCRWLSREAPFNQITDDLIIGRRLLSKEATVEFDHYMDLTAELEDPKRIRESPSYHCLPILDADVPSAEDLHAAVEHAVSGRTFVHCAQGHGRTGLFALALLLRRGRVQNIEEGLALLCSQRPAVRLNRKQIAFARRHL